MMFWNKKKKRVCRNCGYISLNFMERTVEHGSMAGYVDVTEYRCPECGSNDVKSFDYVLNELVSKMVSEKEGKGKLKTGLSEIGYSPATIKKILDGEIDG